MTPSLPQSDLPLTALRYLAGELTADELEAFEQLMASSDDAQRALVHAVQVSAALQPAVTAAVVPPAPRVVAKSPAPHKTRWSSVAALIGSGAVAATALLALRDDPSPAAPDVAAVNAGAAADVALWTELDAGEIEASLMDDSLVTLDSETAEGVQVPDWMFAAIETDLEPGDPATDPGSEAPL